MAFIHVHFCGVGKTCTHPRPRLQTAVPRRPRGVHEATGAGQRGEGCDERHCDDRAEGEQAAARDATAEGQDEDGAEVLGVEGLEAGRRVGRAEDRGGAGCRLRQGVFVCLPTPTNCFPLLILVELGDIH